MPELVVAFLGDVVGSVGRRAVAQAVPILRERYAVNLVIVNGENSRQGSGITPEHVRELRAAGVHGVTLGDHVYKDRAIVPLLEDPAAAVSRPANLSPHAPGKRVLRLEPGGGMPPVYVITVLGRLFMPMPSDSPFEAVDREIAAISEPEALVIVEVHGEATSEKQAMAWHCLGKWTAARRTSGPENGGKQVPTPSVVAVVGTHTHVQTSDARVVDHLLAAITDVGMCGPHRSVIGRSVEATLRALVMQIPAPLDVASDDIRVSGVVLRLDPVGKRAIAIEAIHLPMRG